MPLNDFSPKTDFFLLDLSNPAKGVEWSKTLNLFEQLRTNERNDNNETGGGKRGRKEHRSQQMWLPDCVTNVRVEKWGRARYPAPMKQQVCYNVFWDSAPVFLLCAQLEKTVFPMLWRHPSPPPPRSSSYVGKSFSKSAFKCKREREREREREKGRESVSVSKRRRHLVVCGKRGICLSLSRSLSQSRSEMCTDVSSSAANICFTSEGKTLCHLSLCLSFQKGSTCYNTFLSR